jgi:hypothetical protein
MQTHRDHMNAGGPSGLDSTSNYGGEMIPDNFLILLGRNRDSDILTESNWVTALEQLGGESETVRIDRIGHWACGWVEYLSVDKDSEQFKIAEEIEGALDGYPVLDDEHHSQLEEEAAAEQWKSCYDNQERINYIREFRDQFEFQDYTSLREVIRGEYFNGYASELLQ